MHPRGVKWHHLKARGGASYFATCTQMPSPIGKPTWGYHLKVVMNPHGSGFWLDACHVGEDLDAKLSSKRILNDAILGTWVACEYC